VSATDYDRSSKELTKVLSGLEEMVHEKDSFVITDSEFAFGWHFYIVSIQAGLMQKLAEQMGSDFARLKGKGNEKKFLSLLTQKMEKTSLRVKLAIKEEMESSKYGLF
jgi:hypothetical protein